MAEITLCEQRRIERGNFNSAGSVSAFFKQLLRQLGVDARVVRRVAIASYEAELNLTIHSLGGTLSLEILPTQIRLLSEDVGPGIPNVELAMREGYSTASDEVRNMGFGAGMGLANMSRCADKFAITSQVGAGTLITMDFLL